MKVRVVEARASAKKKTQEEEKERIQVFEGSGDRLEKAEKRSENFTVRKISFGTWGLNEFFHVHSPNLAGIDVVRKGKVRRAKLYYLRDKKGKAAKISEREYSRTPKANKAATTTADKEPSSEDTSEP